MVETYPGGDDHLFYSVSSSYDMDLFFDCVPLEEPFNWLDLVYLTNHTHYVHASPDASPESNFPTADPSNTLLVGGM